jgi:hypothetical protein
MTDDGGGGPWLNSLRSSSSKHWLNKSKRLVELGKNLKGQAEVGDRRSEGEKLRSLEVGSRRKNKVFASNLMPSKARDYFEYRLDGKSIL